jgi:hypothetical protein
LPDEVALGGFFVEAEPAGEGFGGGHCGDRGRRGISGGSGGGLNGMYGWSNSYDAKNAK